MISDRSGRGPDEHVDEREAIDGAPLDPEVARHLETCPACAARYAALLDVRRFVASAASEETPAPRAVATRALAALRAREAAAARFNEASGIFAGIGRALGALVFGKRDQS